MSERLVAVLGDNGVKLLIRTPVGLPAFVHKEVLDEAENNITEIIDRGKNHGKKTTKKKS